MVKCAVEVVEMFRWVSETLCTNTEEEHRAVKAQVFWDVVLCHQVKIF
jgi:hypothetical protein